MNIKIVGKLKFNEKYEITAEVVGHCMESLEQQSASWWSSREGKEKMGASSSREQPCQSIQGSIEVTDRIRNWKQEYFKSNVYRAVFDRVQGEAGRYSFFKLVFLPAYVACWLVFSLGATCLLTAREVLHSFIAVLYPSLSCPCPAWVEAIVLTQAVYSLNLTYSLLKILGSYLLSQH